LKEPQSEKNVRVALTYNFARRRNTSVETYNTNITIQNKMSFLIQLCI